MKNCNIVRKVKMLVFMRIFRGKTSKSHCFYSEGFLTELVASLVLFSPLSYAFKLCLTFQ